MKFILLFSLKIHFTEKLPNKVKQTISRQKILLQNKNKPVLKKENDATVWYVSYHPFLNP